MEEFLTFLQEQEKKYWKDYLIVKQYNELTQSNSSKLMLEEATNRWHETNQILIKYNQMKNNTEL
jgi:hypothetical protein